MVDLFVLNLPGLSGRHQTHLCNDLKSCVFLLANEKVATAAGKSGCIHAYFDEAKVLRASRSKLQVTEDERTFGSIDELAVWFIKNLEVISQPMT